MAYINLYIAENWSRKYGNVVSYVMFGQWTVELFGYDAIHEAFVEQSDIFSNREAHILQKVVKAKGVKLSTSSTAEYI